MPKARFRFTPVTLVICLMVLSVLSLACSTFATHGTNLEAFYLQEDSPYKKLENMGMDLYNSMLYAEKETYQTRSAIYPPLNYLFYGVLARSIPAIEEQTSKNINQLGSYLNTQEAIMTFLCVSILNILLLLWAFRRLSRVSGWLAGLLSLAVLFCGPVLFALERGNSALFTVGLIGCFLLWYRDDKRFLREFALVCLAVGAVMKIYPVVFGLLLVREKRWGESLRCVLYGVVLFFLPFAAMGGWASIRAYFATCFGDAMTLLGDFRIAGGGTRVDLANLVDMVFRSLHLIGAGTIRKVILVVMAAMIFLSRSNWRAVLAVTALCVAGPSFNYYYSVCYYLLPLSLFLLEKEHRGIDYAYALAFATILCVLPYGTADCIGSNITQARPMNLTVFVCNCGQALMLGLLLADACADVRYRMKKRTNQRAESMPNPV